MSNYLTYCKLFVRELGGLAGGSGPAQIEGQTGELLNVVTWIADADVQVQRMWKDWDFLWSQHSETVAADTRAIGKPTGANPPVVNLIDRESLILRPGTQQAFQPQFLAWPVFRDQWDRLELKATKNPLFWTVKPDGTILLSHEMKEATAIRYDFWRKPVRLKAGTDKSLIPHDSVSNAGEDYPRIVLVRAKLIYGERENAPEILSGALAEYADLIEKMESEHLPWMRGSRTSADPEMQAVAIP